MQIISSAWMLAVSKHKKTPPFRSAFIQMAEEEGFEPSLPGLRVKRFSRPPHSTTLPPLRKGDAAPFGAAVIVWRRDGDSNPRYPFGAYTISNRAPSASSDISPLRRLAVYHSESEVYQKVSSCEALFAVSRHDHVFIQKKAPVRFPHCRFPYQNQMHQTNRNQSRPFRAASWFRSSCIR